MVLGGKAAGLACFTFEVEASNFATHLRGVLGRNSLETHAVSEGSAGTLVGERPSARRGAQATGIEPFAGVRIPATGIVEFAQRVFEAIATPDIAESCLLDGVLLFWGEVVLLHDCIVYGMQRPG